jgi:hypothetical protein
MQSKYPFSARVKVIKSWHCHHSYVSFISSENFLLMQILVQCRSEILDTLFILTSMLFYHDKLLMKCKRLIWHTKIRYVSCTYTAYMSLFESLLQHMLTLRLCTVMSHPKWGLVGVMTSCWAKLWCPNFLQGKHGYVNVDIYAAPPPPPTTHWLNSDSHLVNW